MSILRTGNWSVRSADRSRKQQRRGVTILVVLALISVTLAVSYGLLRSQMTAIRIQTNSGRRDRAQQAAMTGLSIGLRKISQSSWTGVGTTISGSLSATESYQVTFSAGDAELTASHPDYAKLPYRVTLRSTGTADDLMNPGVSTKSSAEAVVELVPIALGAQPTGWSLIQMCTVFQEDDHNFSITPPCRIEGLVRLQGDPKLGDFYKWSDAARLRYFSDLNSMRSQGRGDLRPLTGPIHLPVSKHDNTLRSLLTALGVSLVDTPSTSRISFNTPSGSFSYQLFPGGKSYPVPSTGTNLSNTQLVADPATNPLGLFRCTNSVTVGSNVFIEGTLIGRDDVRIAGQNVQLRSVALPALYGDTRPVRLPALFVNDDFDIAASTTGTIDGNILANDDFRATQDASGPNLQILGRITADDFTITGRENWELTDGIWSVIWTLFNSQASAGRIDLFPVWLSQEIAGYPGLNPVPILTIKPNPTPLTAHWQDLSQPIFVPAAGDDGLRWNLVRWSASAD